MSPSFWDVVDSVAIEPQLVDEQTSRPRRLLVISDVHGNWPALEAVLEHASGSYDAIWFLGDLVGYCPYPVECIEFLREHIRPARWRAGNHDLGLFDRLPDFEWSGVAGASLTRQREALQDEVPELLSWFEGKVSLERCGPIARAYGRGQQVWTHANLQNDLSVYLTPAAAYFTRRNLFGLRECVRHPDKNALFLAGHSHIPCLYHLSPHEEDFMAAAPRSILWGEETPVNDGHYYINPGSVGQPRDGNPDACYVILDTRRRNATWHRVAYAVDSVRADVLNRGYPVQLAKWLAEGGTPQTIAELTAVYEVRREGIIANTH